jgi:FkbM family methyltransferase
LVDFLAGHPDREVWTNVEGGRLLVSLRDYVGRAAFYVGDLDRKVSAVIDRFVRPGDTVLDIGANIGLVTLRLAKRVGPNGIVHAFEPNPEVAGRLKKTLEVNRISNVILHEVALGAEKNMLPLFVPKGNAGAASFLSDYNSEVTHHVPVQPLDGLSLPNISFIKMDVEGFEDQVLAGFKDTLRDAPPKTILFEQNTETGTSIPILAAAGYQVSGIAKSLLRLQLRPVRAWNPAYHDYLARFN